MDCQIAREALSARIDGEREPIPAARVDEHLAGCPDCRDWQAAAVEQTQALRRLAGRSQVAAVPDPRPPRRRTRALPAVTPARWALCGVGLVQLALAAAQGLGAGLGVAHGGAGAHLVNESTAWSAALGAVMIAAGLRPRAAAGLAWVLWAFVAVLGVYVVADSISGAVTPGRVATHLPLLAGAVLATLVWRRDTPDGPQPALDSPEIVLPERAARGRRRSHLRPTDGSAA